MPIVNPHPDHKLGDALRKMQDDIRAIAFQQNFGIRDKAGILRVIAGLLPTGDFGLQVRDVNGVGAEILPVYWAQLQANVHTASASYVDLGFPSLSVVIGANGQAKVGVSCTAFLSTAAGFQSAVVGVSIDGNAPAAPFAGALNLESSAGAGAAASLAMNTVITGLTPGSHTFKLLYGNPGTTQSNFSNSFLQVEPF